MARLQESSQKRELPGLRQRVSWTNAWRRMGALEPKARREKEAGTQEKSPRDVEHCGKASGWHGQRLGTCTGVRQGVKRPHLEEVDKLSTELDGWTGTVSPPWHPLHGVKLSASASDKVTGSQTGAQGPAQRRQPSCLRE